jgi:hypothetical protein
MTHSPDALTVAVREFQEGRTDMDIHSLVRRMVDAQLDGQAIQGLRLGAFRDALQAMPDDAQVVYDFGGFAPTTFASYRGFYDDIALGFTDAYDETMTADKLARMATETIGQAFHGYKGGEFVMDESSRLWVAEWGRTSGTVITRVEAVSDYLVVLHTGYVNV